MIQAMEFAHIDLQTSAPSNGVMVADAEMLGLMLRDTHMLNVRYKCTPLVEIDLLEP